MTRTVWIAILLLLASYVHAWNDARVSEPVVIDGQTIPYSVFAVYVMPDQAMQVGFRDARGSGTVRFLEAELPAGGTMLQAPAEPGLYPMEVTNAKSGERTQVNVFVLTPADRADPRGYLNGYRIGRYPKEPLRGLAIYHPPTGFVELTAANADTPLSPNFRLSQFVSKQTHNGEPRYLALRSNLLLKLEGILAALNAAGRPTSSLVVMSGFRTPWYNQAIGNVPYSRHVWGGAADVYIDEAPADGRMDDLNGDGRVDRDDARWLADFVNGMSRRGDFGPNIGGLGIYGSTTAHGPFIHVDARGSLARW